MRPIADPAALKPGATLYHSAFGFARVTGREVDGVALSWERPGAHLPGHVRFDNLRRVYALCAEDGFFHRALHDRAALVDTLQVRPADALAWLLDDLAGPQRLRDVMDWLVGRDLFTPKTFVRWWAQAEAAVRADARMSVEGEWLHPRDAGAAPARPGIAQLDPAGDPKAVAARVDDLAWDDDTTDTAEFAAPDDSTTTELVLPLDPVLLAEVRPPGNAWATLGHALAAALATRHATERLVLPSIDVCRLHPDGTISFDDDAAPCADAATAVHRAASTLVEAFCGRAIPPGVDPASLLPHLRHVCPDLPPSALAPLVTAWHVDPGARPDPFAWADKWASIEGRELDRSARARTQVSLRAGYDSHVGRVKLLLTQVNQDALLLASRGPALIAAVADGISLSDAGTGDLASRLAVQALGSVWHRAPIGRLPPGRVVERAMTVANTAICEASELAAGGDLTGRMPMGTTCLVAAAEGNRVHLSWVGDSRAYLVGPWGCALLTADDNVSGQGFVAWCDGSARAWHADGHALVRYLGHFDTAGRPAAFRPHHAEVVVLADERLVLLSDGVTDYLHPHEAEVARQIGALARDGSPDAAARALVCAANAAGGGDNASVIVLEPAGT